MDKVGRKEWKVNHDYHRRSLSETAMHRFKITFTGTLYSRTTETQQTETAIKIKALNVTTAQGMPVFVKRLTN